MACGSNDRPSPRRETVSVPTGAAGATNSILFGECHPNQLGWVVSLAFQTKVAGTEPAFLLHGQDAFLGTAEMEFGDQSGGILCTQGGQLFCPWPTLKLSFFDQLGSGGNEPLISAIGRPVLAGDSPGASTQCRGLSTATIANGANNSFDAPAGAIAYWVARPNDGGTVEVTVADGAGNTVENYVLSTAAVAYPLPAPAPWRDVPVWNASTAASVEVANNIGSGQVFKVHWLYDLGTLR